MASGTVVRRRDMSREERRSAVARCAELTARSHSNFYLAFLPLPRRRREAIFCVYAFCRRMDDIVDEPEPGMDPRRELDVWRGRVRRIVEGTLPLDEEPLAVGLALTHERYCLGEDDMLAVIDGMEMDLEPRRYRTHDDLGLYCRRVAGHVGCLCLPVFGSRAPEAREYAMKLGHAFQLTNILRDVRADALEGRVYLPQDDLERFGVSEAEFVQDEPSHRLRELMRHEREEAMRLFLEAEEVLPTEERSILFSASIMSAIYRRLLEQMRDAGNDGWGPRASLPRRVKLLLAFGVLLRDRVLRLS